jgi:hypothetical protein
MSRAAIAAGLLLCLSLAACGEKVQTTGHRTADGPPSAGPASAYTAGTWQAGDAVGWDAQMRKRAQGQNEYSRTGSPP